MAKYKRARKVNYFIKRIKKDDEMQYWVYINNTSQRDLILKKRDGWYAKTRFHRSLRDAIIYCLYGV